MKLTYLGSGAAEGVPALYCRCGVCRNAWEKRGRELRTRSQALVNDDLLIDYPADTYAHVIAGGIDLPAITHMLITHSHADHFYPQDLEMRGAPFAVPVPDTLHIYGNDRVEARLLAEAPSLERTLKTLQFHRLTPFEPFAAGAYTVTPLPALHDRGETCLIYAVERDGKALLYGNDTGVFPAPVWAWIEKNHKRFDLVSLDCTCMKEPEGTNHMGLADCVQVRDRLKALGAVDERTVCLLHHFSHNGGWSHAEMVEEGRRAGFQVSYDGLAVEL